MLFEIYFYCCSRNVVIALLILLFFYLPTKERMPGKDLTTNAIILMPRNMPDVSLADAGLYWMMIRPFPPVEAPREWTFGVTSIS